MTIKYWFTILALVQGCLVLGLTIFIFGYYVPKTKAQARNKLRWHVIIVAMSYILLTVATIYTALRGLYESTSPWYWVVTFAYIFGDIALVFVFRESAKKHKLSKIREEPGSLD